MVIRLLLGLLGLQLALSLVGALSCSLGVNPWGAMLVVHCVNWPASTLVHRAVGFAQEAWSLEWTGLEPWADAVLGVAWNAAVLLLALRLAAALRRHPRPTAPNGT